MREIPDTPNAITVAKPPTSFARPSLFPITVHGLYYAPDETPLINGIDLTFEATSITVVMGPNGAGKSLLLRLLHGLIAPTAGKISFGGAPFTPAHRARQSMVFQRPIMLRRSVDANMDFVLRPMGRPASQWRSRATDLLQRVDLLDKRAQPARLLSIGEQQRLALARALATNPEILFLDEPTASLDPPSVARIEQVVRDAKGDGTKIIFVSHDIGQARRLADDVVFLSGGRVTEVAAANQFFAAPHSPDARAYLAGELVV